MSILLLAALLAASSGGTGEIVETRTISRTIPLEGLRGLTVDNFLGAITVNGDGGDDVRLVISERIEAPDRFQLERAREAVSLEITPRGDRLLICADGPFREPDDCTEYARGLRAKLPYRVIYGIDLRVPRSLDVSVSTIEGDLVVSDVRGRLDVSAVQGRVEIRGAAGPVRAGTVSGGLRVTFSENPQEDSSFSTINGTIEVGFQPGLSADLSFETMNGEVLTDFEHRTLPPVVRRTATPDPGVATYRMEIDSAIRIGRGGPRHRFKSIDGDMTIHRN